jgi:hypothetical protein
MRQPPTKFSDILFALGPSEARDGITIMLPKPLDRKRFDALQHAVTKTVHKALTSRRRKRGK